jgi:RES domain-containing protein
LVDPAIVDRVIRRGRVIPWIGRVWRIHQAPWTADDPGGSLVASGRWNRGLDLVPPSEAFPALYTATAPGVADWELIRHSRRTDADEMWRRFVRAQRTWMDIGLPSALDLRDPVSVGLTRADLLDDGVDAYLLPQAIGASAYARGLTGILAPSATAMGHTSGDYNVIVFFELTGTTKVVYGFNVPETAPRSGIVIEVGDSETPNLGSSWR